MLDGVGSIGIGLGGISLLLQGCTLQGQFVILDGDGRISIHTGIVGFLVGFRHLYLHVTLGNGTIDGGILFNLGSVIGTKVLDETFLICHVLDIARNNLNTQLRHIRLGLGHHLIGETVAIGIQRTEVERTDNLAHVTLQRILQLFCNIVGQHVQEVLGSQTCTLVGRHDANLGYGIHIDVDEVGGRYALLCLDVDGNLSEIDPVQTLKEGDTESARTNQHTGFLAETGDDEGRRGGSLDIRYKEEEHQQQNGAANKGIHCKWIHNQSVLTVTLLQR